MGDLSDNISRHEVACKCGCGFDTVDHETLTAIQGACDFFSDLMGRKCTLVITSGCRCLSWNDQIGGSENSQHLRGRAIDHYIKGISVQNLACYYLSKYPEEYGIGTYNTFVHLDTKTGGRRIWRG